MKYGIMGVIVIAVLASIVLVGCSPRNELIEPFDEVKFYPQSNGTVCAEVWIEAPVDKGCSITGDESQNVVALVHPKGRMALPDKVRYNGAEKNKPFGVGFVPVSVYHLTDKDGTEIGYYKRRFARTDPSTMPPLAVSR